MALPGPLTDDQAKHLAAGVVAPAFSVDTGGQLDSIRGVLQAYDFTEEKVCDATNRRHIAEGALDAIRYILRPPRLVPPKEAPDG